MIALTERERVLTWLCFIYLAQTSTREKNIVPLWHPRGLLVLLMNGKYNRPYHSCKEGGWQADHWHCEIDRDWIQRDVSLQGTYDLVGNFSFSFLWSVNSFPTPLPGKWMSGAFGWYRYRCDALLADRAQGNACPMIFSCRSTIEGLAQPRFLT